MIYDAVKGAFDNVQYLNSSLVLAKTNFESMKRGLFQSIFQILRCYLVDFEVVESQRNQDFMEIKSPRVKGHISALVCTDNPFHIYTEEIFIFSVHDDDGGSRGCKLVLNNGIFSLVGDLVEYNLDRDNTIVNLGTCVIPYQDTVAFESELARLVWDFLQNRIDWK